MPHRKRALILASGDVPDDAYVRAKAAEADLVVCADGGARHAVRLRITPLAIIGDLDSLDTTTRAALPDVPAERDPDQETTDLEKCLTWCIARGCTEATVMGALGPRIDHALAALGCLRRFSSDLRLTLTDAESDITRIDGDVRFSAPAGERISLLPLTRCEGVTTEGLRYPLCDDALETGVREGISNAALGGEVRVSVRSGMLLLSRFRGSSPLL